MCKNDELSCFVHVCFLMYIFASPFLCVRARAFQDCTWNGCWVLQLNYNLKSWQLQNASGQHIIFNVYLQLLLSELNFCRIIKQWNSKITVLRVSYDVQAKRRNWSKKITEEQFCNISMADNTSDCLLSVCIWLRVAVLSAAICFFVWYSHYTYSCITWTWT